LHENYCYKNLYRCHCGDVVEKKAKQAHDDEKHTLLNCKFCGKMYEKPKLEEHEKNCDNRPKICEFCENEIQVENFQSHLQMCGSKTNQCPRCKKFIPKRDWKQHTATPCFVPPEPISGPNPNPKANAN